MKNQRVLELANKFADLTQHRPLGNVAFGDQQDRFADFYDKIRTNLRAIISQIGGEITTLKARDFDPKMLALLNKVYQDVIQIYREATPSDPYAAAGKLVQLVLEKPNGPIIDNLDFLAKHHLAQTNTNFKETQLLKHPQMRGLELLKALANHLKQFIATNPLAKPSGQFDPPSALRENVEDITPESKSTPEDVTKPGLK